MRLLWQRGQAFRLGTGRERLCRALRRRLRGAKGIGLSLLLIPIFAMESRAGDSIRDAGDILQYVLPATAGGLIIGHADRPGALQFGESLALTYGATYGLKYTVDERRPNGGTESFPSGHASVSFSAAEFMRKRYGWEYGLPAYAAASFVAYSRVESGEHHPHDVIAGASIGIVSSFIFTRPYKGWWLQADSDGHYFGFRLTRSF